MADTTTRFKVGEIYTIEAHGYGGWNTYELEVTKITPQFVQFSYDAKAVWSRDENGEVVLIEPDQKVPNGGRLY